MPAFLGICIAAIGRDSCSSAGAGEKMEDFVGGEGEPDEAINENEDTEGAPNDEAHAIEWRRSLIGSVGAGQFSCPAAPEAAEAAGNFFGREENHQAYAENGGADEVLDERIAHCA